MRIGEREVHKLSQDFKMRNRIIDRLIWRLYKKPIKLHNRTEEQIWKAINRMDKEKGLLSQNTGATHGK